MWTLYIPVEGSQGVGVEVRGPNRSWEQHAEALFSSIELVP